MAALHLASLLDPEVKDQRLLSWDRGFNWNDVLAYFRKIRPDRKFADDVPDAPSFLGTVDDAQNLKLLKKWRNQDGWTPFETALTELVDQLE